MSSRSNIPIVLIITTCVIPVCSASESSDPNRYLNAVRTFADNVLKYGRDTYGPKHTPLFVDGYTRESVKWKYKRASMDASDLATQRILSMLRLW